MNGTCRNSVLSAACRLSVRPLLIAGARAWPRGRVSEHQHGRSMWTVFARGACPWHSSSEYAQECVGNRLDEVV